MTIQDYIETFGDFDFKEDILKECNKEYNVNFPHIYHTIREFDFILEIDENNEEVKKIKELLCLNRQKLVTENGCISVRADSNMIHLFIALIYISKCSWFSEAIKDSEVVIAFDSIRKKKLVSVSNGNLKFAYI